MSYTCIRIRRGTTSEWTGITGTILALGELGYDTNLRVLKIGDGSSSWANLYGMQGTLGAVLQTAGSTGPQGPAGPAGAASTVPGPAGPQGPAGPAGAGAIPSLIASVPTGIYTMYFNPTTNQINYYRPTITFTINLPAAATITINKTFSSVVWGDGSTTVAQTHAYASAGSYTISLVDIGNQFPSHPSFTPYITNVASFDGITDMTSMFQNSTTFNQDISAWNVSNVTNMYNMFNGATSFNQNIYAWNVSNVRVVIGMFAGGVPIINTPAKYTAIQARATALGQSLV